MKKVLIDSINNIIYEGVDAKEIMRVLSIEPSEITEEDEIKYEDILRTTEWNGKLRYEVHFDLKFRGIDDWNRPVFKDVDSSIHFGDVDKLWTFNELGDNNKNIIKYYEENPTALEYFGHKFNCEPNGGRQDFFKFNFIK